MPSMRKTLGVTPAQRKTRGKAQTDGMHQDYTADGGLTCTVKHGNSQNEIQIAKEAQLLPFADYVIFPIQKLKESTKKMSE